MNDIVDIERNENKINYTLKQRNTTVMNPAN